MIKKIFKIILIIIILLAVGLAAYWYFDRKQGGSGIPLVGNNGLTVGDFFPFGNNNIPPGNTGPITTEPNNTNPDQTPIAPPRLWQISEAPQSGAIAFNASTTLSASTPFVRFVDKATGNIFESSLRLVGLRRISNTTIPKVYKAVWQPNGKAFALQYLNEDNETIKSTFGKLVPSTNTQDIQDLQASFLPNDITSLVSHPNTGALAFIVKTDDGAEVFVTNTAVTDASPRLIYKSAIKDFTISWVNSTTLGLLSKPSADADGFYYFLKTDSGRLERILGNLVGLSALANNGGTKILFSGSTGNSFATGVFDPKTGEVIEVPFKSLSEKCVWSQRTSYLYCSTPESIPSGKYPDVWYQGKVSFNDTIWRMNTDTGATEFLIDPSDTTEQEFDAINLTLDPNEEYLVFTNKKDSQLWGLRIQEGS